MKTAFAFVLAFGMAAGMSAVSAQEHSGAKKYDKGSTVTLQGCVTSGQKKDTWVLTKVREWPAGSSEMGKYGRRYYWIDKNAKDFRAHGGHTSQHDRGERPNRRHHRVQEGRHSDHVAEVEDRRREDDCRQLQSVVTETGS